ncbi:MAG: TetR/AcrR family transcriptional regulator [Sphingomonas sp.]|nr:TetR/AcrR family transcriptional regulator [Sphingomonas sp.]
MNRPYLSADQRRAEAVATVIELAATHDPAVMTTGQIASAMGVSQGALFRHFPDKMAIWTAVLEWTCGELNHRLDVLPNSPPLSRLEAILAAHVDFVIKRPGVPRILFGELQRAGDTPTKAVTRQLMAGYRARVARELHAAREAGDIAGGTDVEAATVLFLAMVQGMVMQGLAIDDFSSMPALAHRLFGLFRHSLGASSCA